MPKQSTTALVSPKVGVVFLLIGGLTLGFSVYYSAQVLAFVGLGLTFWGAVFLLTMPKSFVEATLLTKTALPEYSTLDRIIHDLKYVEKAYYIPPYPKGTSVPEHLKGLKDTVVYVSSSEVFTMPSIEDISQGKFLLANQKGMLIVPPGLGFLEQIQKKLTPTLTTDINELCEILPRLILENFPIAKDLTMTMKEENVHLVITDSVYKDLYRIENKPRSLLFLGCPTISAVACLLAQATGKTITTKQTTASSDGSNIEIEFMVAG